MRTSVGVAVLIVGVVVIFIVIVVVIFVVVSVAVVFDDDDGETFLPDSSSQTDSSIADKFLLINFE